MKSSKTLIKQLNKNVAPENAHSSKTCKTEAGQAKSDTDPAIIDAINQTFTLFRVNYHNQYYAAFNSEETLNQTKRLWLESLSRFTPEIILRATKKSVEESEYLPTLHRMLEFCQAQAYNLPSLEAAYREACLAATPKSAQIWSHPVVFYAGRDTGWHILHTQSEKQALVKFKHHYERYRERVIQGESFNSPTTPKIEQQASKTLNAEERKEKLDTLKKLMQ